MGIRLICSDLDGTLLQYGKKELEGEIFRNAQLVLVDHATVFT